MTFAAFVWLLICILPLFPQVMYILFCLLLHFSGKGKLLPLHPSCAAASPEARAVLCLPVQCRPAVCLLQGWLELGCELILTILSTD